jgi:mycothiol synthase
MSDVLAPGYSVRHPVQDDVHAVQALTAASDLEEFGVAEGYTVEEILNTWRSLDLEQDAWLVVAPTGDLAGYAYLVNQRHVRLDAVIYVHPAHFGHGIGTTLLRVAEARAREHLTLAPEGARVTLQNWISGTNAAACALLEHQGYAPQRYFHRMERALAAPLPAPVWPDGIAVRRFVRGQDERLVFDGTEEAMRDHWGHIPASFEEWSGRRFGPTFDADLWFLAEDGDHLAGVALCSQLDRLGWVDTLAVRRSWRGRGVGMALLLHGMHEFQRRGLEKVGLSVDARNPTGATRLYERAGMHLAQLHAVYGKELRPGTDLAGLTG